MDSRTPVVVVTGASSGIGRACAEYLGRSGYQVFGTCRNAAKGAIPGQPFTMIDMDITSDASVLGAAEKIAGTGAQVDILVCSAGMGIAGAIEDSTIHDIALQLDTNFLGTARTVKAFLPGMRKAGKGRIFVIGSMAGLTGMPFQASYSASKFALEGFVESLRYEVRPFGIEACIIEPGDFRTGFTSARTMSPASQSGAYDRHFRKTMDIQIRDERTGHDPAKIGILVGKLLKKKRLPVRITTGPLFERFAVCVKRIIPAKAFEIFYRIYYKLP